MIECTICGRNGATLGGLFRHCHSACVCATCWDGLARSVLAEAEQARGARREARAQDQWITRTLAQVARSSSAGH